MKLFTLVSLLFTIILQPIFARQLRDVDTTLSPEHQRTEAQLMQQANQNITKYRKGDVAITITDQQGKPLKNAVVKVDQLTQDFLFGNLCEEGLRPSLKPEEAAMFQQRFTALFNFTELDVKWVPYESQQGKPQWQKLQEKLDWCKANNIKPKGHNLAWTHESGTPRWLYQYPLAQINDLLKARIQNLVGGFKNQVTMWDVVNEPITTIPWEKAIQDTVSKNGLIDAGIRYNTKGITVEETLPWVENAYKWAGQANPKGDYVLNEFYVIAKPEIRERFYQLVKQLLARNTPVTSLGIQGHEPREMWFSPLEVIKTFDRLSEFGLPLHITEFTPQSSGKSITGGWRTGVWTEAAQAEFAKQFYTLAFSYPSMKSIHWWGLSDRMIWLPGGGLLDKNFQPKPVYDTLYQLIKKEWMTKDLALKTNDRGAVGFRGFAGNYQVTVVDAKGNSHTFEAHLNEQQQNPWAFTMP